MKLVQPKLFLEFFKNLLGIFFPDLIKLSSIHNLNIPIRKDIREYHRAVMKMVQPKILLTSLKKL